MKKIKRIDVQTLIVAVDIGKTKNTGYCRCPDGSDSKVFEFPNNIWGFNTFWHRICRFKDSHNLKEIVIGFESTGGYGEPLVHYLRKQKVRLVQVNPMHTKRLKELQGNSPNKTDQKDPKVIADIIELGHSLSLVVPEGAAAQLRRLTQARERSVIHHTTLLNQLHSLVFIIFPEFLQVVYDLRSKGVRHLLKHCPTPESIVECGLDKITVILRKASRGRLGRQKAEMIYQVATQSVGIKAGRESILLEIGHILSSIESSEKFIKDIEMQMANYLAQIACSKYILSMKGIGKVIAAGLIGEVGDFAKFDTCSEIMKLAGLDLFEISSGKHRGQRRISKRGRSLMRKFLYYAAFNAVRKGGALREQYERYLQRGMIKTKALIAIARKVLRIIFALVRNHNVFIADYAKEQNLTLKAAA